VSAPAIDRFHYCPMDLRAVPLPSLAEVFTSQHAMASDRTRGSPLGFADHLFIRRCRQLLPPGPTWLSFARGPPLGFPGCSLNEHTCQPLPPDPSTSRAWVLLRVGRRSRVSLIGDYSFFDAGVSCRLSLHPCHTLPRVTSLLLHCPMLGTGRVSFGRRQVLSHGGLTPWAIHS